MGYEFTVVDLNQIELDKEPEKYAAKAEEKLKLDEDSLNSVAGESSENEWNVARACDEHDWVYCGLVKGEYWGYNRRFVCSKCGAEDYCWDKWPWQD